MATRSVAETHGLDFLALKLERFDLLKRQRDHVRAPMQTLLGLLRDAARARELAGLDVGDCGAPPHRAGRTCAVVPRNPFFGAEPRQIANFTIS
jgi:molybdate-binding protein